MKALTIRVFILFSLCALFQTKLVCARGYIDLDMSYRLIGFSEDGQYLAFQQSGQFADYGAAQITVVDVVRNSYAARPFVVETSSNPDPLVLQKEVRARARGVIRSLGVREGNFGNHLFTWKEEPNAQAHNAVFSVKGSSVQLQLDLRPYKSKQCGLKTSSIFSLSLNQANKKSKIFQKDSSLPNYRGCPYEYAITDVYEWKGMLAVFLTVYNRGFENEIDRSYMVVTGSLDTK
jgi:predicted secreted protein